MSTLYVPRPSEDYPWVARHIMPSTNFILSLGNQIPFRPPYWKFHYDDAAFWVGSPNQNIPPARMPVGGGYPFLPRFWKYDHDSPGFWEGKPNQSIVPALDDPVGGGYPFKPPYWKYHYDDEAFWVGAKSTPIFQAHLFFNFTTTTDHIQLPVNCVMAGDQIYARSDVIREGPPKPRITYTVRMGRPKN